MIEARQTPQRFALIGAGFWSQYHLAAWREIGGVTCVAVCDRSRSRAEQLSARCGSPAVYEDARELLDRETVDFVDIVTDVDAHVPLATMALERGVAAICQKPLAPTLAQAHAVCRLSRSVGVPLLVHENWRWQAPLRRLQAILASGELGPLVRARIDYAHSFAVFDNQPALKQLRQFMIADMGTHILDVSRYLFGEAVQLYCQTRRMRADIAGEDVATVMLRKESGLTVTCNMSYASRWEYDRFPQTMVAVEGTHAGVSLQADNTIRVYGGRGVERTECVEVPRYDWCHPQYALVHASMVACQRNLLAGLTGAAQAETTCADNLRTLELVFGAYASAERQCAIDLPLPAGG